MTFTVDRLPYDHATPTDIESYARKLEGRTLRPFVPLERILNVRNKGEFGNLLEEFYFFKKPDNNPAADFAEAGVELKSTPLSRLSNGLLVPKERLVLSMIDYFSLFKEEWANNTLLLKNALLLLIFYLWEDSKNPVDFEVRLARLWRMPVADLLIIQRDWELIAQKVKDGLAHKLSESDTLYLAACTKGGVMKKQPNSPELAKSRAFSLKQSYLRSILHSQLGYKVFEPLVKEPKPGETFEDVVNRRFRDYIGKTREEIAASLGLKPTVAKNRFSLVTKAILKIAPKHEIAEFEKAGVVEKTIRVQRDGTIEQHVSFPAFDYNELASERWTTSTFRNFLVSRFFFVVFREDEEGEFRLRHTFFWSMPEEDRECEARKVWLETVRRVRRGDLENLPKSSENDVAHVRPHDRRRRDIYPGPKGSIGQKKCFWLRNTYLEKIVETSTVKI